MLFTSARCPAPRCRAPLQGAGEQPRGVQRLQQVVADRREELGLRQVGLFRLALYSRRRARPWLRSWISRLNWSLRVVSSAVRLAHPLFEVLVGLVQRLGGPPALGYIPNQHE